MSQFHLTFDTLRRANTIRLPLFKNRHGEPAHTEPDGSDWTLGEWMTAVTGEVGEAANLIKKIRRGDLTIAEGRALIGKELADVVCYIDLLAEQLDLDLGYEVAMKFNEISARVGAAVLITRPIELRGPAGHFVSVINVNACTAPQRFMCLKCNQPTAQKIDDICGWDGACSNCGTIAQAQVGGPA